jgi:hypothetical protein
MKLRDHTGSITDIVLLGLLLVFLMVYFDVRYLFYDTIVTGGDTASWHGVAHHMLKVLLPNNRLTGWDMGNFCGYPNFSFYFIPPFLLAVLPSYIFGIPLTITLKLAIMSGIFLFPFMTYFGLRSLRYSFPIPVIGASASLLFLFNELYTMFGGNTLSTLVGEFCYMFAFAIFAYFIGSLYKGLWTNSGAVKNGILLAVIGLSHLFVFIPAVFLLVYWFFEKGNVRYLFKVSLLAFGLMAFWILPLIFYRYPYTTPVYMIWQAFVDWHYTFMGIGIILLFIGPRLTLCAMGQQVSVKPVWKSWHLPMLLFSALSSFIFFYLVGQYLILGKGLWATGLKVPDFSASPLGANIASLLHPLVTPVSLAISMTVAGIGLWAWRWRLRYQKFCLTMGSSWFLIGIILASIGLYILVCRSITDVELRSFFLKRSTIAVIHGIITLAAGWVIFFSERFSSFIRRTATDTKSDRFRMFLGLAFGCVVGYFSAHFLEVPDIRFLPPLLFVLILIFFADTLSLFFSLTGQKAKVTAAVAVSYLCILVVIFWASKSDVWFRYNNEGYENRVGYREFINTNNYLRTIYQGKYQDPLNAPRVGYEKCNMYGRYGGDRVFESLPLFSGRQTMEGIHYASSIASKFIVFLQTEYSRDIKTPKGYILSKLNPDALPAHLDLYNISQLILMTDKAKKAVSSSPLFEKEAVFGAISIYRYKGCIDRYVDLPRIRPVLYAGRNWLKDFFNWYKNPDQVDILLVPKEFVKDKADRRLFANETASVSDLSPFGKDTLDRTDLKIETHLEHLKISFTTNKVGVPHLIKVSYFPNWQVQGAHGVYPVSPHLMLVIPRKREVVLTYGTNFWERFGMGLSASTIMIVFLIWLYRFIKGRFRNPYLEKILVWTPRWDLAVDRFIGRPMERMFTFVRPYILILTMLTSFALIVAGAQLRNRPVRAYIKGYRAYKLGAELLESRKSQSAEGYFKKAIRTMAPIIEQRISYDHQDVIHCILFTAMAYERLGEWDKAELFYRSILTEYPYCRYVGEAYVKIARIRKQGRDQVLEDGLRKLREDDIATGLSFLRKALHQTHDSLRYFNAAIREDPYSVWAEYALDDIKKERNYFRKRQSAIFSLCDQDDIKKSIEFILGRE